MTQWISDVQKSSIISPNKTVIYKCPFLTRSLSFQYFFPPFISYRLVLKCLYPFRCLRASVTFYTQIKYLWSCKHSTLRSNVWGPRPPRWSKKWSHWGCIITEKIALSKCPSQMDICAQATPYRDWEATDKSISKGRNLKTSGFLEGDRFLLISRTPLELITPWETKEAILHANLGFNVTHHTFKFRSPDMEKN